MRDTLLSFIIYPLIGKAALVSATKTKSMILK